MILNCLGLRVWAWGYQVIVAHDPIADTGLWMSWATSHGVFSVDATAPAVTITQPAAIAGYTGSQSVLANWTTNQNLTGVSSGVGAL